MGDNKVEVLTQGALTPVDFYVEGGNQLGEFLVGSDSKFFTLVLKNNNAFRISNINLDVDAFSSAAMKFATNEDGESKYPGNGGTCAKVLASGENCTFVVEYSPSFSGDLKQKFTLSYSNLINQVTMQEEVSLFAGEAANLAFVSEIINYDYGYLERTEPTLISKTLTVINNGGLTARNMVFGTLYSHNSGAFSIKDNNCSDSLSAGETCSFTVDFVSKNYGPSAPDLDVEQTYTCNPRFDYIRDPEGGKAALSAFFTVLSTTIEGNILSSGITQLEFSELTVGNIETRAIKIQNYGFKEAIVHNLEVYDAADNKVATCIKVDSSSALVCQDPLSVSKDGVELPLSVLPLRFSDTTGCINKYDDLDYTRDEQGQLSNPNLFQIEGKTNETIGGSCFLEVTFWPSVTNETNGNINDYKLRFGFDSTWKNNIVIYGQDNSFERQFLISEASWLSAAKIQISEFQYGVKTDYTPVSGTEASVNLFDLGRIALISNNSYKQPVKISYKNIGYTDAEVVTLKDAQATPFNLTEDTVDINPFYLSLGHVGCTIVNAVGGDCNIRFNLAPMASSLSGAAAEAQENGYMFDVVNPYPEQYKKFIMTYKDGSTYNDDGSLRVDREIEVWIRALLVRKGFLVFSSTSTDQGTKLTTMGDTPIFHHILLKNAGTGPIPVIEKVDDYSLLGTTQKNNGNAFPFEIVDRPDVDSNADGFFDGEAGAAKDCYDILVNESAPLAPVSMGTNASSVLNAGEECSLTVKMKIRGNDVTRESEYSFDGSIKQWERFFDSDYQNDHELWAERYITTNTYSLMFRYYDGDGISDPVNGYYPDENGYGNYFDISGGNAGLYSVALKVYRPPRIIPVDPLPMISSIICRDQMNLPAYTIASNEWGTNLAAVTVAETCMDYTELKANYPVSNRVNMTNYVKANYSGYDYIYHAGYFSAGSSYDLSIRLEKKGDNSVRSAIHSYTGDTTVLNWTNAWSNPLSTFSNRNVNINFNPSVAGSYSTDLIVSYKNNVKLLDDEASLSYSDQEVTFRIKIIAEALDAGSDNISLSSQDYTVTYDKNTDLTDDTLPKGSPAAIGLHHKASDMTGNGISFYAIRESAVYDKKVLTLKNNSSNTLTNFQFNIKQSQSATIFSLPAGSGLSIEENNCLNITMNPSDECTVTLHYKASKDEVDSAKTYGAVVYNMGGNALQMKNFEILLSAGDPAILETLPKIATKIIKDSSNFNIKSIPLDLGLYADAGHPVVSDYPLHRVSKNNLQIVNTSVEKASLLAQWEALHGSTPLPGGSTIEIYNTNGIIVEANRYCFFGDDEGTLIPAEEQGFNKDSVNACRMNFHFDLDDTYFGEVLDSSKTYFSLAYYNNLRASTADIIFHFTGFIEPNRTTFSDTQYANVEADENGNLYFEWASATPSNSSWGGIVGYRVFYSPTKNSLTDVFKALEFKDTVGQSVNLNGLTPGRYYYLKVVAKRETLGGKVYISDVNSPIRSVIIPPEGYIYNYDEQVLFPTHYSTNGGPGLKEDGADVCAGDIVVLSENGVSKSKPMKLINSDIWNIIESNGSYSDYGVDSTPHWLSDAPVDISFIFADFSCSETSGDDGGTLFYTKDCSNCSCNNLSIVKGGDGQFLPPGSTIYIDGESMSAFFRCYIDQ